MAGQGKPYRGVLYAGLMLTDDGPRVLEFNCRFGDPECQLLLPLLEGSLVDVCADVALGRLRPESVHWCAHRTYGVVLATHGYPESPRSGDVIRGLDAVPDHVQVFHAGTRRDEASGDVVTAGGRVLTVVGEDLGTVYEVAEAIQFSGKHYRTDIDRQ
jgi:phosphoribosylamine--glycine ligase